MRLASGIAIVRCRATLLADRLVEIEQPEESPLAALLAPRDGGAVIEELNAERTGRHRRKDIAHAVGDDLLHEQHVRQRAFVELGRVAVLDRLVLGDVEPERVRIQIQLERDCSAGIRRAIAALAANDQISFGEQENLVAGRRRMQTRGRACEGIAGRGRQLVGDGTRPARSEVHVLGGDDGIGAFRPANQPDRREHCRQCGVRLIVGAGHGLHAERLVVDQQRGRKREACGDRGRRQVVGRAVERLGRQREGAERLLTEQRQRVAEAERIDRRTGEVRTARLRVAALTCGRQHRLIRGDREKAGKFVDRYFAAGRYFDAEVVQPVMPGIEERLDRHGRLVVEQDDQLFADMDERDLLVRD